MASMRERVLDAVKAMVADTLPNADVTRGETDAQRRGPGGSVNVLDGDPGEPTDVTLSPLLYTYSHLVPLDVAAFESASMTRMEVLDAMLGPIGLAIEADRTLGGLCEWMEPVAPAPDDIAALGSDPMRWVTAGILCVYSTPNPFT